MCRLFGLHAGTTVASADFWLVDAPDSLEFQSRTNADGFGVGAFDESGTAVIEKEPLPAWKNPSFALDAHRMLGTTFVAHVRHATNGALALVNTHPFEQDGRLFAHNGVVAGIAELDERLAAVGGADLVLGDTDSERIFALITAETRRESGDIGSGITAAVSWIVEHLQVLSLNFILTTSTDVWALRYPETDTLFLLERPAGGSGPTSAALAASGSHLAARSDTLADRPSVVIASERMNDDPLWVPIAPGELVHVNRALSVDVRTMVPAAERGTR